MNVETIYQLAHVIGLNPEKFDMTIYGAMNILTTPDAKGCICGFQNSLMNRKDLADKESAAADLGLSRKQMIELFYPSQTRTSVWYAVLNNWTRATAEHAEILLVGIADGSIDFFCDLPEKAQREVWNF